VDLAQAHVTAPLELWHRILYFFVPENLLEERETAFYDTDTTFWQQKERTDVVTNWLRLFDNNEGSAAPASSNPEAPQEGDLAEAGSRAAEPSV